MIKAHYLPRNVDERHGRHVALPAAWGFQDHQVVSGRLRARKGR
jgi:hypothetical protein